jgi:hypothetical protein
VVSTKHVFVLPRRPPPPVPLVKRSGRPPSPTRRCPVELRACLATYREELTKCVLVCANCHGEIEAGLRVSPPAGAHFGDMLYMTGPKLELD